MLQTRNGKRTSRAPLKIAVDLVNEACVQKKEALMKIDPNHWEQSAFIPSLTLKLKKGKTGWPGSCSFARRSYGPFILPEYAKEECEKRAVLLVRLETHRGH